MRYYIVFLWVDFLNISLMNEMTKAGKDGFWLFEGAVFFSGHKAFRTPWFYRKNPAVDLNRLRVWGDDLGKTLSLAGSLCPYLTREVVKASLSTMEGGTGVPTVTGAGGFGAWLWLLVVAERLWAKYFMSSFLYERKMIVGKLWGLNV